MQKHSKTKNLHWNGDISSKLKPRCSKNVLQNNPSFLQSDKNCQEEILLEQRMQIFLAVWKHDKLTNWCGLFVFLKVSSKTAFFCGCLDKDRQKFLKHLVETFSNYSPEISFFISRALPTELFPMIVFSEIPVTSWAWEPPWSKRKTRLRTLWPHSGSVSNFLF